jgi:hypothetical protein
MGGDGRKRIVSLAALLCLGWNSGPLEAEIATVHSSSGTHKVRTPRAPSQNLKNLKRVPGNIQRAIKKTKPNPNVSSPRAQSMPTKAPDMPRGPQTTKPLTESGADRFFRGAARIMTRTWGDNIFVFLPAISTDPNAGPTVGVLPVLVLADPRNKHIRHLLAPSYTYNHLFGQTGTMRYYWYPTDVSQLYLTGSLSQRTNREAKVRFINPAAFDGVFYLGSEAYYTVDASMRFYGLTPNSRESDETGYAATDSGYRLAGGVNFGRAWRSTVGFRFRRFTTGTNVIPDTVDLKARFPEVPGVGTNNTVAYETRLLWDTRDSAVTPSRGSSGEIFAEKTAGPLGSDSDYFRYGLEGKRFFLWKSPKHVTVVRGLFEKANGSFVPFYELPTVGGRESVRGFGDGRFYDRGRLVVNLEHRITFASLGLMGVQTNFEFAPFFDLGTVYPKIDKIQRKDLQPVVGGAFRAAVKPNVVGDVEVGVGREGVAVFVDINYPF